jgi:hypothetical protein
MLSGASRKCDAQNMTFPQLKADPEVHMCFKLLPCVFQGCAKPVLVSLKTIAEGNGD